MWGLKDGFTVEDNILNQEGKISKKYKLKIIKKPAPSGTDKDENIHRHPIRVSGVGGDFR